MDHPDPPDHLPDLVGLQMADHVILVFRMDRVFLHDLLHVVLAEDRLPHLRESLHHFDRLRLGDGDQRHFPGIPARRFAGLPDILLYGPKVPPEIHFMPLIRK